MKMKPNNAISRYRDAYVIHAAIDLYRACYAKFGLDFKPSNHSNFSWLTIELMKALQKHLIVIFSERDFDVFKDSYDEIKFILTNYGIMHDDTYYTWGNEDAIQLTTDFYGERWQGQHAIFFVDAMMQFMPKPDELFSSPEQGITPLSIIRDGSIIDNISQGKLDAGVVKLKEVMNSKLVTQIESIVPLNKDFCFLFLPNGKFMYLAIKEANELMELSKLTYADYFNSNMRNLVKTDSKWFEKLQYYIFRPLHFIRDAIPNISKMLKNAVVHGTASDHMMRKISRDQYLDNLQSSSLDLSAVTMYEQDPICFQDVFSDRVDLGNAYPNPREYYTYIIDNIHEQAPELFELLHFNYLQRNTWYHLRRDSLDGWLFGGHDNVNKKINAYYYSHSAHIFSVFPVLKDIHAEYQTLLNSTRSNVYTHEINFAIGWLYGYYGSQVSQWIIIPKTSVDMSEYPHETLVILTDRKLKFQGDRVTFKNMLTCVSGISSHIIPDNLAVKGEDENLRSLASSFSALSYLSTGLFGFLAGGAVGGLLSLAVHGLADAALSIGSSSASMRDFDKISEYVSSVGEYRGLPLVPYNASVAVDRDQDHPLPSIFTGTNVLTSTISYIRSVGRIVSCGLLGTTTWSMMAGALGSAVNFSGRIRRFVKAKKASKFRLYDINGQDFNPKSHGELLQFVSSGKFSYGDKLPDELMRNFFTWKEFSLYSKANGLIRPILLPQFSLFGRIATGFSSHAISSPLKVVAALGKEMSNRLFEDDSETLSEIEENIKVIMKKLDRIDDGIGRNMQGSGGEE